MPRAVEASVDSPISRTVGQILPAITWETGRLKKYEYPRCPSNVSFT